MFVCRHTVRRQIFAVPACYNLARSGMHIVRHGAKMAAVCKHFTFSLQSASNDHYIERNESSSPALPTINGVCCETGIMSNYYSCTVYALQFQATL